MRFVLDTAVIVAAIRSDTGASRKLLEAAFDGRFTMLMSVPLTAEYEAVITRREHLVAAGLSNTDAGILLDALVAVSEPVALAYLWRPVLPDADDDMVLDTAMNGRADAIVTFNRRDFAIAEERLGMQVVSPAEALKQLEKRQ